MGEQSVTLCDMEAGLSPRWSLPMPFGMRRGKGRPTTLSDLEFLPSAKTWNPEPSVDTSYDEPPDPE
jgi:hypothetical protein